MALRSRWPGRVVLALLTAILTLGALEAGARIWNRLDPSPSRTQGGFRASRPAPYEDAGYFTDAFLAEQKQHRDWYSPSGARLVLPRDFAGRYYNISAGRRRTEGQPREAARRIVLFGGSGMFCEEVPDGETIASHLQDLLNGPEAGPLAGSRVENLGALTVGIAQQIERMQTMELGAGDLVVFYDGVNDAILSLYHAAPRSSIYHLERDGRSSQPGSASLRRLRRRSVLAGRIELARLRRSAPRHLETENRLDELEDGLSELYRESLASAAETARAAGAGFHHFLQPHLFSTGELTDYETELAANPYLVRPGLEQALRRGYEVLRTAMARVSGDGVRSRDLSAVLAQREEGEEFFLDYCHVNHRANRRIARAMFDAIQNGGGPRVLGPES